MISKMKLLFKSVCMIFKAAPVIASFSFILVIADSFIPAVMAVLSASAINELATGAGKVCEPLFWAVLWWIILLFVSNLVSVLNGVLLESLGEKLVDRINGDLIKKSSSLKDLYNFENPDFHSDINMLRSQAMTRPVNLVANITLNIKNLVILLSMLWILGSISLWIPVVLVVCIIPDFIMRQKLDGEGWLANIKNDKYQRRADYFVRMMLDTQTIKEAIWLGIGDYVVRQYKKYRTLITEKNNSIRCKKALFSLPTLILSSVGNIAVFLFVVRNIKAGIYSIGTLVLFLQSFFQVQMYLSDLVTFGSYLKTILLYFDKFFHFIDWQNRIKIGNAAVQENAKNTNSVPYIEFKNVSFCYDNNTKMILDNVSFTIEEGMSVALVGANGAGKSTLVKLLMRFYEPVSGQILFRGIPICNIDIDEWRKNISCVFQDFAKYELNFFESVSIPIIPNEKDCQKVTSVLKEIEYPGKIENVPLGKEFGGTDLSVGQWQKIAIARSVFHGGSLLVMDEPTASIDPIAEAQFFKQFQQLCEEKTCIMVTHRLASAVDADKIIVLNDGRIVQSGSHKALMSESGLYKQMFFAQAEKYRVADS